MTTGLTYVRGRTASDTTETGAVPRVASPFADFLGARVEEGTTNVLTNPSAELDLATISHTGVVTTRVAAAAVHGSYGFRTTCSAGSASSRYMHHVSGPATSMGQAWTITAYVRRGNHQWVEFGDAGHSSWHSSTFDVLNGVVGTTHGSVTAASIVSAAGERFPDGTVVPAGWWKLTVSLVTSSAANLRPMIGFCANSASFANGYAGAGTEYVDSDAWQAEQRAYATSYCDGSLGDG